MPCCLYSRRAVHDDALAPGDMAVRGNRDMDERTLPVGDLEQLGGCLVAQDSLRSRSEQRSPKYRFSGQPAREHAVDAALEELPPPRPNQPVDGIGGQAADQGLLARNDASLDLGQLLERN
jgi:hypothetical protein